MGIRYARTSYTDLASFADAAFDAVVSFMALMDGPRFDPAMAECCCARAGGSPSASPTPASSPVAPGWIHDEQGVKVSRVVGHYFEPARWVNENLKGTKLVGLPVEATGDLLVGPTDVFRSRKAHTRAKYVICRTQDNWSTSCCVEHSEVPAICSIDPGCWPRR